MKVSTLERWNHSDGVRQCYTNLIICIWRSCLNSISQLWSNEIFSDPGYGRTSRISDHEYRSERVTTWRRLNVLDDWQVEIRRSAAVDRLVSWLIMCSERVNYATDCEYKVGIGHSRTVASLGSPCHPHPVVDVDEWRRGRLEVNLAEGVVVRRQLHDINAYSTVIRIVVGNVTAQHPIWPCQDLTGIHQLVVFLISYCVGAR